MNAYKFHVKSFSESKRYQELLWELGYLRQDGETSYLRHKTEWLTANPDGVIGFTTDSGKLLFDVPYVELDYEELKRKVL